jgi:hypothetical protein
MLVAEQPHDLAALASRESELAGLAEALEASVRLGKLFNRGRGKS